MRAGLRPCSPHAAADALVVEHLPFAARVAANYARRTGHPREDLEQLAAIGLIKASRRYDIHRPGRSPNHFIAYARPFVNGEITHYLRDKGFADHSAGPLAGTACAGAEVAAGGPAAGGDAASGWAITPERWREIGQACSVRVVAMAVREADPELE